MKITYRKALKKVKRLKKVEEDLKLLEKSRELIRYIRVLYNKAISNIITVDHDGLDGDQRIIRMYVYKYDNVFNFSLYNKTNGLYFKTKLMDLSEESLFCLFKSKQSIIINILYLIFKEEYEKIEKKCKEEKKKGNIDPYNYIIRPFEFMSLD